MPRPRLRAQSKKARLWVLAAAFAAFGFLFAGFFVRGFWPPWPPLPKNQPASQIKNQKKKRLMVLTYSSFAGVYGPGRKLKSRFESFCGCEIQWLVSEDSTALIQRLFVYPSVDLIVGLDQISALEAVHLKWQPLDDLYSLASSAGHSAASRPSSPAAGQAFSLAASLAAGQSSSSADRQNPAQAAPAAPSGGGFFEKPGAPDPKRAIVKEALFNGLPLDSRLFFMPIDWAPAGFLYKESSARRTKSRAKSRRTVRKPSQAARSNQSHPSAGAFGRAAAPAANPTPALSKARAKQGLPAAEIISLRQLPELQGRVSFPDPRTSVLGMQLYYWIYQAFGGDFGRIKAFLARLRPKIYGPVFSWSRSYGLFQKGRADMSLSYLTSLAYHLKEEGSNIYRFARFREGHPVHVEFAALPAGCRSCDLAREFAGFLLSKEAQKIIMESHYMLPAREGMQKTGAFAGLGRAKAISYKNLDRFLNQKKQLLGLWERAMR